MSMDLRALLHIQQDQCDKRSSRCYISLYFRGRIRSESEREFLCGMEVL